MTDVRPSRALFNSALFAVAAFLSFSIVFLACRGENPGRERERLQKEIEQVNDSLKLWQEEFRRNFITDTVYPTFADMKKHHNEIKHLKDSVKNHINHFTHLRDSLHRRLKELPPPK